MTKSNPFPITKPIVILIGPTAIGKTSLSIELAKEFNFEIISVDSMQVYRFMDIGTAKITKAEMEGIPHHLIDIVNPDELFNAGLFEKIATLAITDIIDRGKNVLITGGTGLYLSALLNGLIKNIPIFPEIRINAEQRLAQHGANVLHKYLHSIDRISADRIHKNDSQRLVRAIEIFEGTGRKWSSIIAEHQNENKLRFNKVLTIGLRCERNKLYSRIERRSKLMIKNGLRDEVNGLLEMGYDRELKSMQAIGYSHMIKLIHNEWTQDEFFENLTRDTRRYAKRQFTWFNKINDISWFDMGSFDCVNSTVSKFIYA